MTADPPDNTRSSSDQTAANALWGGRFARGPAAVMERINASIDFDRRLADQDIRASKAHAEMLAGAGILSRDDAALIIAGLDQVAQDIASGRLVFKTSLEDVHMNVEAALAGRIGPVAGRLHTARSRNDQVATDFRLWVRDALDRLNAGLRALQGVLVDRAEEHADTVMPGYTHLQSAQPVTFGHHLLAYVEMLGRDRGRVADARRRLNECPLGAAALAGTSFPIDRDRTAGMLGFDRPAANSLDAVSDRDFALEYLATASLCAVHLSRLAEELVLWSSDQFRFIRLSDAFSTGSSIMPQKRNPDAAELARAKSGRVIGHLVGLLTVVKGLPLAYAKDLQEDKEPVFDTDDSIGLCVAALTGMVGDMAVDPAAMRKAAEAGFPTATDLADWLVRTLDMPFRQAHHVTGQIVRLAETRDVPLDQLPLEAMRTIDDRIDERVYEVLGVDRSVASRTSYGGTAPDRVRAAAAAARERFL